MRSQVLTLLEKYEERVLGQSTNLRLLLAAILSGGHVLLEESQVREKHRWCERSPVYLVEVSSNPVYTRLTSKRYYRKYDLQHERRYV